MKASTADGVTLYSSSPTGIININPYKVAAFDGNSLIFGAGAIPGVSDFPTQLCEGLLNPEEFKCVNSGVGGATIEDAYADAISELDVYVAPSNSLILWIGTNDLILGKPATSIASDIMQYISARKSAGWEIAVLTIPPMGSALVNDDERILLNEIIRSNLFDADAVLDVAQIPELQDPYDSTYRTPDGIHYTAQGYSLIADYTRQVVQDMD